MKTLDLEKFNPTKAELTILAKKYKNLKIKNIGDKEGYLQVNTARKELSHIRVNIKKAGKALRSEALTFQKAVIAKENELIDIIEPLEIELKEKQKAIDDEKERIKRKESLPERKEKLQEIDVKLKDDDLLLMDDNCFYEYLNGKKQEFLEEKERKIEEAREKIEADKIKIKEAQDKIKLEKQRNIEMEKAKKEAADKAKLEMELKIKKEKEDAEKAKQDDIIREQKEKEKLEKQKKYQTFLKSNNYNEETKNDFIIQREENKITLFKKIDEIKI